MKVLGTEESAPAERERALAKVRARVGLVFQEHSSSTGVTQVMVTHDLKLARAAEHVYVMDQANFSYWL